MARVTDTWGALCGTFHALLTGPCLADVRRLADAECTETAGDLYNLVEGVDYPVGSVAGYRVPWGDGGEDQYVDVLVDDSEGGIGVGCVYSGAVLFVAGPCAPDYRASTAGEVGKVPSGALSVFHLFCAVVEHVTAAAADEDNRLPMETVVNSADGADAATGEAFNAAAKEFAAAVVASLNLFSPGSLRPAHAQERMLESLGALCDRVRARRISSHAVTLWVGLWKTMARRSCAPHWVTLGTPGLDPFLELSLRELAAVALASPWSANDVACMLAAPKWVVDLPAFPGPSFHVKQSVLGVLCDYIRAGAWGHCDVSAYARAWRVLGGLEDVTGEGVALGTASEDPLLEAALCDLGAVLLASPLTANDIRHLYGFLAQWTACT